MGKEACILVSVCGRKEEEREGLAWHALVGKHEGGSGVRNDVLKRGLYMHEGKK